MTFPDRPILVRFCADCGAPLAYVGAPHAPQNARCRKADGFVPQGSVERAIFRAYAEYPTLYGRSPWSRWHILEHLFVTNGNGFEWEKGMLVEVCRRGRPTPLKDVRFRTGQDEVERWAQRDQEQDGSMLASIERWRKLGEQSPYEELFDPAHHEAEWATKGPPTQMYPLCEYAELLNVPDDVHADWLAAAFDVVAMLELVPANFYTKEDPKQNNTVWTALARADLQYRFKGMEGAAYAAAACLRLLGKEYWLDKTLLTRYAPFMEHPLTEELVRQGPPFYSQL